MKQIVAATAVLLTLATVKASADDTAVLSPAALDQLTIAEKLIALGRANHDPLLLIAAAQIRNTLSDEAVGLPEERTDQESLLEEARQLSNGRKDLIGIADDIAAQRSKGCSVRYGCQNPYIN